MSKYTTEVRFLCESLTGHTESVGFTDANTVIADATQYIFDFEYPIFDNAYKSVLETKILRHYYTREIGEETYGLWKLRLQDRLNVIMPYYNQLYESTLLSFNPFYDVDLTTEHSGNDEGVVSSESVGNTAKSGRVTNKVDETVDENGYKTGDNYNSVDKNESRGNEHTGTVENEGIKNQNVINSTTENETGSETNGQTRNIEYSGENTAYQDGNREIESSENTSSENSSESTEWNLFSDTPQGGITGIEGAQTPGTLDSMNFLTNATKNTSENSGDSSGSTDGKSSEVNSTVGGTTESNESTDVLSGNKNTINDKIKDSVETGDYSENSKKTYDERNDETITGGEIANGGFSEVNGNNVGRNLNSNGTNNENISDSRTDSKVSTTTEQYLQRVSGKSGGMSYSAMLMEFRDTFINIDEMIIEELSDLFFGLW